MVAVKAKKPFIYEVDGDKKIIYIDDSVEPTEREVWDKKDYMSLGFKIKYKSQARVARGKSNTPTKEEAQEELASRPDLLEQYNALYEDNYLKANAVVLEYRFEKKLEKEDPEALKTYQEKKEQEGKEEAKKWYKEYQKNKEKKTKKAKK